MAYVPPLGFSLEETKEELNKIRHPFRIAIERAKNPFNIGAIIRVAHSFLVKEIILIGTEPFYERAAMGMHRYENITEIDSEQEFLDLAQQKKWSLVAFEKDFASVGLWDAEIPEDAVLVFGNENTGLSEALRQQAKSTVAIPMYGINHSYPVSVAAGMAMAEWARRYYSKSRLASP